MQKKVKIILFIFIFMMVFVPLTARALDGRVVPKFFYVLDYCDSSAVLGDARCEKSVAWLLQKLFDIIKVIGPILVVILSSVDFIYVIAKSDDEAMAKAGKKLGIRLALAALLFFIPTIVSALLNIFGITSSMGGLS